MTFKMLEFVVGIREKSEIQERKKERKKEKKPEWLKWKIAGK